MIKNECEKNKSGHIWTMHIGAGQQVNSKTMFICEKCKVVMTASEVFQLEALENQSETLKHLKGFQSKMVIVMAIISILSLIVAIFK